MAEALHVLPLAGGLFDQPAGYVTRMEAVLRATAEQEKVPARKKEAEERVAKRARALAEEEAGNK